VADHRRPSPTPTPRPAADHAAGPTISVVVPTFRRRAFLPPLVDAVLEQDPHELIVVVDGNVDGSLEALRDRADGDPRLRPIGQANRGSAAARQRGLDEATGDVVLFLDDDVIPRPGLLAGHLAHHRRGPDRVVVGYMPNDPDALDGVERAVAELYARSYETIVAFYERHPDHILYRLWGGNLSIRRDVGGRVGLISALDGARHEDQDFGLRCVRHGLTGVFDRTLAAEHRYQRSLAGFRADGRRSGAHRVEIHERHVDIVGPDLVNSMVSDDRPGQNLARPLRSLLPLVSHPPIRQVLVGVLVGALRLPLVARSRPLATTLLRGIGTLETQGGVNDARRSARRDRRRTRRGKLRARGAPAAGAR
jgi:GT2 family glycosyltransferase